MKKLLTIASLFICLRSNAQIGWFVNTNLGIGSLSPSLPTSAVIGTGNVLNPSLSQLAPIGWCNVTAYQNPASNYTATAWSFSNSAPASVGIYITSSINNSSNIVSQWLAIPGFMQSVSNYYSLIHPYTGSAYTGSVVNVANTLGWILGESRTNSAFTLSNLNDAHWCMDYSQVLNGAPGNPVGTTATFPWGLWWMAETNGYPLQ